MHQKQPPAKVAFSRRGTPAAPADATRSGKKSNDPIIIFVNMRCPLFLYYITPCNWLKHTAPRSRHGHGGIKSWSRKKVRRKAEFPRRGPRQGRGLVWVG